MAGLRGIQPSAVRRAQRWDAVVLGSGVRGLVAACRLGAAGHRVLIVEEDATRALAPCLREPFFLAGKRDGGVLDVCLRELQIAMIDRRRIEDERLAYQVVSRDLRFDLGGPNTTAEELVVWGLAKPEAAQQLVRDLVDACEAERDELLGQSFVKSARRAGLGRRNAPPAQGSHVRGLPASAAQAPPVLSALLDTQAMALSNGACELPRPEERARLLGLGLAGGAGFQDAPPWLLGLLRRRVESLYGEFRSIRSGFEIVNAAGQPALSVHGGDDLWIGRSLVIACAPSALLDAVPEIAPRGELLPRPRQRRRRLTVRMRAKVEVVPEGMCPRVVFPATADPALAAAPDTLTLTAFPAEGAPGEVDLVARTRLPDGAPGPAEDDGPLIAAAEAAIEARIREMMPFSDGRLFRKPFRRPAWDDDDGWLEDPDEGGRSHELELRASTRPAIYHLDRAPLSGLGLEGDLLIGWRGGDAIAADLPS